MNSQKISFALVVHSCDRYEFLYQGFEHFFSKYWPSSIDCKYYFATEEKKVNIQGFENILSGKGEWSDRLLYLLKEKIKEDYIIYFQEDMWITKPVNASFFNELFSKIVSNKWEQVKLHSSDVYKSIPTEDFIQGFNVSVLDNQASDFLMSHQVTVWNREYLISLLPKGEHPWRNERKGSKRMKLLNPKIIHLDYFSENGKQAINKNINPVQRSEYQTISVNGMLNGNVQPLILEIKLGNEADKEYSKRLQFHFDNQITHDGKPKPRKVGFFKKIKNWLKGR